MLSNYVQVDLFEACHLCFVTLFTLMKILLLTCNILQYLKIKSVATMSLKPKGMMVKEDKGQNADDPSTYSDIKRCPSVDKAQHPVLYLLTGRPRSRHTRGTMPRSFWWGTSVIWRMNEWWLQRGAGSCQNSWVSQREKKNEMPCVFCFHTVGVYCLLPGAKLNIIINHKVNLKRV